MHAISLALVTLLASQQAGQGLWEPPVDLGISCDCCVIGPGAFGDEIVHASLIPVGKRAGSLLFWTRCDFRTQNDPPYRAWAWDPVKNDVVPFEFPFTDPVDQKYGPFCAGHCWVLDPLELDDQGHPRAKLLVAGGRGDGVEPLTGVGAGSIRSFAFDPLDEEFEVWPQLDFPQALAGYYYPSVIAMPDLGPGKGRYSALLLGGSLASTNLPDLCALEVLGDYGGLLTVSDEIAQRNWTPTANSGTRWHQFPRLYVLSSGGVLQAGHAVTCESGPVDPAVSGGTQGCEGSYFDSFAGVTMPTPNPCDLGYGGNPVRLFGPGVQPQDPNLLSHPNAASLRPVNTQLDPESDDFVPAWYEAVHDYGRNVGAWHYCSGAILHTLEPGWSWPIGTAAPGDVSQYELDRVIVTGGTYKQFPVLNAGADPYPYYGIQSCLEYDSATGAWTAKAPPLSPRALGANFVLLPTGELLLVGGARDSIDAAASQLNAPELFDPARPDEPGAWTPVATRYAKRTQLEPFYPRNYHSVAVLLPNGTVALTGGKNIPDPGLLDGRDTVEVYRPEYLRVSRERPIFKAPPAIRYQTESAWRTFQVGVEAPEKIASVCLIGVGSVTHHFDYGQRYVGLPFRVRPGEDRLDVLPPPNDRLAPPGYYLLFLVSDTGIPSAGSFVLLDY